MSRETLPSAVEAAALRSWTLPSPGSRTRESPATVRPQARELCSTILTFEDA